MSLASCLAPKPHPYFGGQDLEISRGGISRGASISRPIAGLVRVRACASMDKKFVLAIKLGPKAGCWLKAPDFSSPSRFCPVPGFFFAGLEPRKRAILPSKIAYVIENKGL